MESGYKLVLTNNAITLEKEININDLNDYIRIKKICSEFQKTIKKLKKQNTEFAANCCYVCHATEYLEWVGDNILCEKCSMFY